MKSKFAVIGILIVICLTLLLYLRRDRSNTEPAVGAPIIGGLHSYMRMTEVEELIRKEGMKWKVNAIESDRIVDVSPFVHLGSEGKLALTFDKDRLRSVEFFPLNLEHYLEGLAEDEKQNTSRSSFIRKYMHKNSVFWEDKRLADESVRRGVKRF